MKKQQSCIRLMIFHLLLNNARTEVESAVAELASGEFFFAVLSCEYTHIRRDPFCGERKTKLLRVENIRFFNNTKELYRRMTNLASKASSVQITFKFQKNRLNFQSITMYAIEDNFCLVKIWTKIVQRILSYPKGSIDSPVNLVRSNREYKFITSRHIRTSLCQTVKTIGENKLGIQAQTVGTHSICSTFAMILLLENIRMTIIKKFGRWLSDAVICYVQKNVLDFSKGVSKDFSKKQPIESFYNAKSFIESIRTQHGIDSD